MPDTSFMAAVTFDVQCAMCGEELAVRTEDEGQYNLAKIFVTPCASCIEAERQDAYEEGLSSESGE